MPKKRISKYEEFFVKGDEYAQCVLCGKGVKRQVDGGTNTMRNHLNVHHKEHFVRLQAELKAKQFRSESNRLDINKLFMSIHNPTKSSVQGYSAEVEYSLQEKLLQGILDNITITKKDNDLEQVAHHNTTTSSSEGSSKSIHLGVRMSIAIVQAGTVLYDTPATMDKLERFVEEAAAKQSKLIIFPEGFVGGYPKWNDFGIVLGTRSPEGREEYKNSILEYGPESMRLAEIAAKHGVHLVVGAIERDGDTLYCSVFFYSPEKYLGKHRKLLPTALERCVWGCGDGSTMPVFDTELGKIGAAICWENYMPLYRVNLYSKGIQLYLAPTVDDREVWLSTMRMIALEGRCFVISACQFLKSSAYPVDHQLRKEHGDEKILIRGGSCAVDPLGTVLVEPDFSGEMIRYVDVDLSMITKSKFDLDTVGHYSRPDIFQLHVNEKPQKGVVRMQ